MPSRTGKEELSLDPRRNARTRPGARRETVASDLCPIAFGRSALFHALIPGSWSCQGDITDLETSNRAREFVGRFQPNYLVWNAGICDKRPIKGAEERFDAMIDTQHLRGLVKFIREFHRLMLAWAPLADPLGRPYQLVTSFDLVVPDARERDALLRPQGRQGPLHPQLRRRAGPRLAGIEDPAGQPGRNADRLRQR